MCQNNSTERKEEKIFGGHRRMFSRDHRQRSGFRRGISIAIPPMPDGSCSALIREQYVNAAALGCSWRSPPSNKTTVHLLELLADCSETLADATWNPASRVMLGSESNGWRCAPQIASGARMMRLQPDDCRHFPDIVTFSGHRDFQRWIGTMMGMVVGCFSHGRLCECFRVGPILCD